MPRLLPVKYRLLVAVLHQLGFEQTHQKGGHQQFKHADGRRTTVPVHGEEEIGVPLLKRILKEINLSREEWEKEKMGK